MSPYYPPPKHVLEVCAHCHTVQDNPLRAARCCKEPALFRYQKLDEQLGTRPKGTRQPTRGDTRQSALPIHTKVETCLWCDEKHAGGPENCNEGWRAPGGSL